MSVRIRLPELMKQAGIPTAYRLSVSSGGRISMTVAHRLVREEGRLKLFDADTLDALCDVFNVDVGALLERESARKRGRK